MSNLTTECPNCGAPLKIDRNKEVLVCDYCKVQINNPNKPTKVESSHISKQVLEHHEKETENKSCLGKAVLILIILSIVTTVLYLTLGADPKKEAKDPTPDPAELQRELEYKLHNYLVTRNNRSSSILDFWGSYFEYIKVAKTGPTCKENNGTPISVSINLDSLDRFEKEIVEAMAKQPQTPDLDAAALAFVKSAKDVGRVMQDMTTYFEKGMHKIDDCAKAQRLHPQLLKLYPVFEAKRKAFYYSLVKHGKGLLDQCLQRTAGKPSLAAAHQWASFIKKSRVAMEVFRKEYKKEQPNINDIKQQIAILSEAAAAVEALSDQQKSKAGFSSSSEHDAFIKAAVKFMEGNAGKEADKRKEAIEKNPDDYITIGMGRNYGPLVLEGSFASLNDYFNRSVSGFKRCKVCGPVAECEYDDVCPNW